jgi:hypothetical protein
MPLGSSAQGITTQKKETIFDYGAHLPVFDFGFPQVFEGLIFRDIFGAELALQHGRRKEAG